MPSMQFGDRLHIIRFIPNGPSIAMFKDDPGVYLMNDGKPASDAMAKKAGYDVRRDRIKGKFLSDKADLESNLDAQRDAALEALEKDLEIEDTAGASTAAPRASGEPDENGILRTAAGELRETPNYRGKHRGGANWTVTSKESLSVVEGMESVSKEAMLDFLQSDLDKWEEAATAPSGA